MNTTSNWSQQVWRTDVPTVVVQEVPGGTPTGLLDRHGNPFVRPKPPIGFIDFSKLRRR
jgi:hypothetical protein